MGLYVGVKIQFCCVLEIDRLFVMRQNFRRVVNRKSSTRSLREPLRAIWRSQRQFLRIDGQG